MTGDAPHGNVTHTEVRRGPALRRRTVLSASVAAGVLATTGVATTITAHAASAPTAPTRAAALSARGRGFAFLDSAMDGYPAAGEIRLAQSYADQAGLFSTAFVYDNAITILAYLSDQGEKTTERAVALGDALLYAQAHDPEYKDGRLRQAYNVGPYTFHDGSPQPHGFIKPDGTANVGTQFGFTGTATGDMAWAALAFVALYRRTKAERFLAAAIRISEWIVKNCKSDEPLGGWKFGVNGKNEPHPATSTEHNIDLIGLFGQLFQITGKEIWNHRRWRAQAFVKKMWEPDGQFFYTGTNDGETINKDLIPEDTQTWAYLALEAWLYRGALDWEAVNLKVSDNSARKNSTVPEGQSYEGVTFTSKSLLANEDAPIAEWQPKPNRNGVWFEGSAHLALAFRERGRKGDEAQAAALIASIEKAQDLLGTGQTIGGQALTEKSGVVSASSPLDTGFGFGYYPYKHSGATAWYLLALNRSNPLNP
jgi:hypothetical protein